MPFVQMSASGDGSRRGNAGVMTPGVRVLTLRMDEVGWNRVAEGNSQFNRKSFGRLVRERQSHDNW